MVIIPASHRDLIDQPGIGTLSTVGADGTPQVTALWYLADGDVIRTSLQTSRQKYRNVAAHPKATLFIFDPANPFRTLEIRADATFEEDPDLILFERILRHYGKDPDTFSSRKESRITLTLTPTRVVTQG
jgi:PPOX class probable F420-dependent enzyme